VYSLVRTLFISVDPYLYMDFDKKMMRHFNFKLALKWIIVFAIFVFLGRMVWNNWNQVKDILLPFGSFLLFCLLSFCLQLFYPGLGMVSHHIEVGHRSSDSGDIRELVLLAIGEVSAGEGVASPEPPSIFMNRRGGPGKRFRSLFI